ncbi:hypothetical protein GLIP_1216 [Aliiglaciecola lipolytica E3]|uniref:Uncharacterized protein n=2 Tax=Aliiglaciecola TaxID=1406885 RepID=K6Y6M3_9ALTE|nr:hypothetical protein GLIP_1216 [Aliiglaciecola lipolytica E3]
MVLLVVGFNSHAQTEMDIGYDSKYVTEGRNNLVEGGIVWVSVNHQLDTSWLIGAAYGEASNDAVDYDELNVSIAFSRQVGDLWYSLNYTRLEFYADNQSDNELGVFASWEGFEHVILTFEVVYSSQADGSFLQLGVTNGYKLSRDLMLSPYAKIAFDFGYASERSEGHNHYALGANLRYQFTQNISVISMAEYNIGGSYLKDLNDNQSDQAWAGLHLNVIF